MAAEKFPLNCRFWSSFRANDNQLQNQQSFYLSSCPGPMTESCLWCTGTEAKIWQSIGGAASSRYLHSKTNYLRLLGGGGGGAGGPQSAWCVSTGGLATVRVCNLLTTKPDHKPATQWWREGGFDLWGMKVFRRLKITDTSLKRLMHTCSYPWLASNKKCLYNRWRSILVVISHNDIPNGNISPEWSHTRVWIYLNEKMSKNISYPIGQKDT